MQKKRRPKKEHDFAVTAFRVVQEAVGEESATVKQEPPELTPEQRHAAAVALGRLGGKKGGPARAKKLTKDQRREFARRAAEARWNRRSSS